MKKKIIIPIIIVFVLSLIIGFYIFNNRVTSYITLDINPSIKMNLTRNLKVKNIEAINEDAKDIISTNLKGKKIAKVLKVITDNVIKKGYVKDKQVTILLYSTGNIDNKEVEKEIRKNFEEKEIFTEVILIDKISKEDEKLAKKYNITVSKAAYINSLKKENPKIEEESLIHRSVSELKNTKISGFYCDKGYTLEGSNCLKKISEEKPIKGQVCPEGYYEYNGICYKDDAIIDGKNYICNDDFKLEGKDCVREEEYNAIPVKYNCPSGELVKKSDVGLSVKGSGDDEYICLDKSNAKKPTLRCLTINHIMINGECYVGPAPVINGGCPNNDSLVGGGCYSKDDGDQWVCTDGRIYEKSKDSVPEFCPETLKYSKPNVTEYKCEGNDTLKENKCIKKEIVSAQKERLCRSGYTLLNDAKCIDYSKTTSKTSGYICNNNDARLENNKCIIYELVEAKHS